MKYEVIGGRDALLTATGHHPYVMLTTTGDITGYRGDSLVAWVDRGSALYAIGDAAAAVEFAHARRGGADWLHLPHLTPAQVAPFDADVHDDWDHLIARTPPPPAPDEEQVVEVQDAHQINTLLDLAFPASTSRPGDPKVRRWYGIRHDGDLVAVAADRSRGGTGYIAGVAVHPEHRRRSLGATITATLTRRLFAEFGNCSLSVMSDADGPRRLYERLGYGEPLARTSLKIMR